MLKFLVYFSLAFALSEALIQCMPNACATVRCAQVTAENCAGKIVAKGGFCGCCDLCKDILLEGAYCGGQFLLGVPSHTECGTGMDCDFHTMRCVSSALHVHPDDLLLSRAADRPCDTSHQHYLSVMKQNGGMGMLGAEDPHCDGDGYYQPKQCDGSVCYCVSKEGRQIQTYRADRWTSSHMNCQCARDQQEYMATGLIGRMFYCTDNGNYQAYQCVGSVCHCTDDNGQMVGTQSVNIGHLSDLKC